MADDVVFTGLSICIPVYNYDCSDTINSLLIQLHTIETKVEIVVIDDNSPKEILALKNITNSNYTYKRLDSNIGRSKIRNMFLTHTKYSHILFLDGDSGVSKYFLSHYEFAISSSPEKVICGGRKHLKKLSSNSKLRYNYGVRYEDLDVVRRSKHEYLNFMTNNFVVPMLVFENIKFNETISEYGHEDTLFGLDLKEGNIRIKHIDNPVVHLDLEPNDVFLEKTEKALFNLIRLGKDKPQLLESTRLYKTYKKISFLRFGAIAPFLNILSFVCKILAVKFSSVKSLQLYKLMFFVKHYR
jgi:hypothetical protein